MVWASLHSLRAPQEAPVSVPKQNLPLKLKLLHKKIDAFPRKTGDMFQSAVCAMPGTDSLPRTISAIVIVPWDLGTQVPPWSLEPDN